MPKGGKRKGAGRPVGTGKCGVETYPIRAPKNLHSIIEYICLIQKKEGQGFWEDIFARHEASEIMHAATKGVVVKPSGLTDAGNYLPIQEK